MSATSKPVLGRRAAREAEAEDPLEPAVELELDEDPVEALACGVVVSDPALDADVPELGDDGLLELGELERVLVDDPLPE
jgi:hypothetical protein